MITFTLSKDESYGTAIGASADMAIFLMAWQSRLFPAFMDAAAGQLMHISDAIASIKDGVGVPFSRHDLESCHALEQAIAFCQKVGITVNLRKEK